MTPLPPWKLSGLPPAVTLPLPLPTAEAVHAILWTPATHFPNTESAGFDDISAPRTSRSTRRWCLLPSPLTHPFSGCWRSLSDRVWAIKRSKGKAPLGGCFSSVTRKLLAGTMLVCASSHPPQTWCTSITCLTRCRVHRPTLTSPWHCCRHHSGITDRGVRHMQRD